MWEGTVPEPRRVTLVGPEEVSPGSHLPGAPSRLRNFTGGRRRHSRVGRRLDRTTQTGWVQETYIRTCVLRAPGEGTRPFPQPGPRSPRPYTGGTTLRRVGRRVDACTDSRRHTLWSPTFDRDTGPPGDLRPVSEVPVGRNPTLTREPQESGLASLFSPFDSRHQRPVPGEPRDPLRVLPLRRAFKGPGTTNKIITPSHNDTLKDPTRTPLKPRGGPCACGGARGWSVRL